MAKKGSQLTVRTATEIQGGEFVILGYAGRSYQMTLNELKKFIGIIEAGGGSVDLTQVSTDILPLADVSKDIGSLEKRWKKVYSTALTVKAQSVDEEEVNIHDGGIEGILGRDIQWSIDGSGNAVFLSLKVNGADVATMDYVNNELSKYVTTDTLTKNYVSNTSLTEILKKYYESGYVDFLLSSKASTGDLNKTNAQLGIVQTDVATLKSYFQDTDDVDDIINKWRELEAFLAGQTETSTLAELLSVKADKSTVAAINSRVTDLEDADFVDIDSLRSTLGGYYTKEEVDDLLGEAGGVDLTGYINEIAASGTGNGIASVSKDGSKLTFYKATFLTSTTVPAARENFYGGIQIGYKDNGKNYGVLLDSSGKAYVNVPWESYDLSKFLEKAGGSVNYLQVSPANASDGETINIGVTTNEISGIHGNGVVDWKINSNGAWIGTNQLATQFWVEGKGYLKMTVPDAQFPKEVEIGDYDDVYLKNALRVDQLYFSNGFSIVVDSKDPSNLKYDGEVLLNTYNCGSYVLKISVPDDKYPREVAVSDYDIVTINNLAVEGLSIGGFHLTTDSAKTSLQYDGSILLSAYNYGSFVYSKDEVNRQLTSLREDIESSYLKAEGHTASRVIISNGSGNITTSDITTTKLGYLSNVTGDIQSQINAKQNTISDLSTIRSNAANGQTAFGWGNHDGKYATLAAFNGLNSVAITTNNYGSKIRVTSDMIANGAVDNTKLSEELLEMINSSSSSVLPSFYNNFDSVLPVATEAYIGSQLYYLPSNAPTDLRVFYFKGSSSLNSGNGAFFAASWAQVYRAITGQSGYGSITAYYVWNGSDAYNTHAAGASVAYARKDVLFYNETLNQIQRFDGVSLLPMTDKNILESYFTQAKIKSTLGISDWALVNSKPTYTAAEVGALPLSGGQITGSLLVSGAFILEDSFYIGSDASNYASIDSDGNGVFKSLKVGSSSVALVSDLSGYLPKAGGEMANGSRISHGNNMYIGRDDNVGWVGLQDICSQTSLGDSVWSIRTNGVARFQSIICSSTTGSHIIGNSNSEIIFQPSNDTSGANIPLKIAKTGSSTYTMYCDESEVYDLGTSSYKWNILYCRSVSQSSDATLKNILGNVELTTSQIANAPAVNFTWKNGGAKDVGTIAQYWKNVLPEVVIGEEGSYGLNYATLGVVLSIILARNIETHEEKIARLEREVYELKKELNKL